MHIRMTSPRVTIGAMLLALASISMSTASAEIIRFKGCDNITYTVPRPTDFASCMADSPRLRCPKWHAAQLCAKFLRER